MKEKLISAKSYWTKEEAEAYERSTSTRKIQHMMTERVLKEMRAGGKILDIGCGTGFSMEVIGENAFGIDVSLEMLKIAKGKGFDRVVLADFKSLPFKDSVFDGIVSISTLQWIIGKSPEEVVEQYRLAFREMRRVLRKGGKVGLQFYPHTEKEWEMARKELSRLFSGYVVEEGKGKKKKRYLILSKD
ncbi:MAG: class I SAM-dependent methyltransferase [Candidatus Aenigmatarchaeota archaeon]